MSKIIKTARVLRLHWKKSTVFFSAVTYGTYYSWEKYKTFQILRSYCEEAKKYGDMPINSLSQPRHVTVILNPEANDKKSKIRYEKFAAPILHLAGLKVSVFQTENEGQATDLMTIMANTDAVIIAGGNGTLQEAVTGLFRRPEYQNDSLSTIPVGILPLGKTNTVAKVLFNTKSKNDAVWLAEAAIAIVRETTGHLDVLKVQSENEKADYAMVSIEHGLFPDVENKLGKYWYFGPLKDKVAYFVNAIKKTLCIDDVNLNYLSPCDGCSTCYLPKHQEGDINVNKRWWAAFIPKTRNLGLPSVDYSNILNDDCGVWHEENQPKLSNLIISTGLRHFSSTKASLNALWINLFPWDLSTGNYIQSGLEYHKGLSYNDSKVKATIPAKEVKFDLSQDDKKTCYIDSEKREFQHLHVTLLPKRLLVYN